MKASPKYHLKIPGKVEPEVLKVYDSQETEEVEFINIYNSLDQLKN